MARRTDGEKIDELEKLVATLIERVDNIHRESAGLPATTTKVALLEHQFADLKKGQENWGQRLWMLASALVGAVVGGLLTHFLSSRR